MKSFTIACILLLGLLVGCRKSEIKTSGIFPFGESDQIMTDLIDVMLKDHETEFRIAWSGHGGGDSFSYDTSFFIKGAKIEDVSARLGGELTSLESKYQVTVGGSGVSSGGSHHDYDIEYTKDGILYFSDFLLEGHEAEGDSEGGVSVTILHKGVRR